MMSLPRSARPLLTAARFKAAATLFVCTKCRAGKDLRRQLKRTLKETGRKRELRIVACGCLDVCPKRGTMTVLARNDGTTHCAIVTDATNAAEALAPLLDQGVGHTVTD